MMYNTRHLYIGQNKYCSTFEEIAVSLFRYCGDVVNPNNNLMMRRAGLSIMAMVMSLKMHCRCRDASAMAATHVFPQTVQNCISIHIGGLQFHY